MEGQRHDVPATDPFVGRTVLGTYRVGRRVGQGGFGAVYEADHLKLDCKVALKTLESTRRLDPASVERFHREARVTSQLTHPSAVKVFDRGETDDGVLFIAMELLSGETLEERLSRDPRLAASEVVEILEPICEVLAEAHDKGIVHRDLKPRNIMLVPVTGGHELPKVFDFGIAALRYAEGLTEPDQPIGTPAYMAPEMWRGRGHMDARADIYALGVIAYRALSGRLPVEARSTSEWLEKHRLEQPRDLAQETGGAVSAALSGAVMRAICKNPEERYPTALAFRDGLRAALRETRAPDEQTTRRPFVPKPPRRLPKAAIAAVVLALVGAGAWRLLARPGRSPVAPSVARCGTPAKTFMPLKVGNWWRYRVTTPDTDRPYPVDKTVRVSAYEDVGGPKAGVMAFRFHREDAMGSADRWLRRVGDRVLRDKEAWFDTAGRLTTVRYYLDSRLRVDESCERTLAGATWTERYQSVQEALSTGKRTAIEEVERWTVMAVDEAVTVPRGTFRCFRVHRRNDRQNADATMWFAAGIGKIMEHSPPEEHEELVDYFVQ